ncbi:MAG TPA: hypothetical protein VFZ65_00080 [Planctomycetota bacterium]|nr:hypothetical protein [Planctomycetota bacterium]
MASSLRPAAAAAFSLLAGCTFHSTATHWHGRVDPSGKPVFVKVTTNVGLNVAIILPLLGATTIDTMLDECSGDVERLGSDGVRVIQTNAENYWYGFPPFTWVLTPVITDVAIEYTPSEEELRQYQAQRD